MPSLARATYKVEIAWEQNPGGNVLVGYSTIGSGRLGSVGWSGPFSQADDLSDSVVEFTITRGRSNDLALMNAGEATLVVRDPSGRYNRKNAQSPLYGKLEPLRPVRIVSYFETERAVNGGFEADVAGWTFDAAKTALTRSTGEKRSGTASGRVEATVAAGTAGSVAQTYALPTPPPAGRKFTATLWFKAAAGSQIYVELSENGGGDSNAASVNVGGDGTWREVTLTLTIKGSARTNVKLAVALSSPAAGDAFHLDDVSLLEHAYPYPLYYGWTRRIDFEPSGRSGIAQIECTDLFLRLQRLIPVLGPFTNYSVGAIIGAILDLLPWRDPAMRSLAVGSTIPTWSAQGERGLPQIEQLLVVDRGTFFIAGSGRAVYYDRYERARRATAATIASEMTAIAPGADLDAVENRRTARKEDGADQVALDRTSIDRYGENEGALIASPYFAHDDQALQLARWLVSQTKDPRTPVWRLRLENRTPALLTQILARELLDRVSATEAQTNTSVDGHIEQIRHRVRDGRHSCDWLLSERSSVLPIMLGSSVVGGGHVLAY